jgi:DNA-binding response OmpR family regulator
MLASWPPRGLVIADGPDIREELNGKLANAGLEPLMTSESWLTAIYAERPDLVVLDLSLSDDDAMELLESIRTLSAVPVLAVVGTENEELASRAIRAGATDFVTARASPEEVSARVEVLRLHSRDEAARGAVVEDEFLRIDHPRHRVEVLGTEVSLTPTEFRMLAFLVANEGRVLGHDELLMEVWGDRSRGRDAVKLYVSYLRRRLAPAGLDPVETVRGIGYRYQPRQLG